MVGISEPTAAVAHQHLIFPPMLSCRRHPTEEGKANGNRPAVIALTVVPLIMQPGTIHIHLWEPFGLCRQHG